jgi:hypothetical protein
MSKPARRTAIHETGHALAFWWNGRPIDRVTVRTKAECDAGPLIDSSGNPHRAAGLVEASPFLSDLSSIPPRVGEGIPSIIPFVERDLLHYFAGPVAEAIHTRTRLDYYFSKSGRNDSSSGDQLIDILPIYPQLFAESQSVARSSCLVRRYWPAVNAIADLLQERGTVDGNDVAVLLCEITGEAPTFCGNDLSSLDTPRNKRWANERTRLICRAAYRSTRAI